MILVDSSVWIDYFNGQDTLHVELLDQLLSTQPLAIGDIILTEVLQGFRQDADYVTAKQILTSLTIFQLSNTDLAINSADNFRTLRKRGITVRKTVDVIIATFCIEAKHALLFSDRDFIPFVQHLGLDAVQMPE
ncbi:MULTISPECIES: PIN domain nuclease [Cyanophyceae]|uniref:type II toxin-antitoxin system VapC family toxin n=1 Tax=Cyanophyceae TaxID=3028117 RepID=UPI001685A4A5|nr:MULTISPECIES: PIN domain nuclease [Cyanophyceae]MBD1918017.1 PIN domain nuclease [Phormidium sp. FACHB-77]MBD2029265.1 PIN domain nuclease [Phormidium sp. FACHB-322]MBD2049797.1 PIN domain nuclease [Leptolyngbya sp. FACHB-60]